MSSPTEAALDVALLGFWMPCSGACQGDGQVNQIEPCLPAVDCPACRGSGKRYPFRLDCEAGHNLNLILTCTECGMNTDEPAGYVFNPDAKVLFQAIRDKGGDYCLTWKPEGDFAVVGKQNGTHAGDQLPGTCWTSDKLRDLDALKLALVRTMEAMG